MSRGNVDQATIIILDIGENVSTPEEKNAKSFFDQAKECTARILERKIMAQTKELVGIVLLGSKRTKNNMADLCKGAFRHIELHVELQAPTWKMIRELPEKPTKSRGDWVDSLVVAADHLKNAYKGKISAKKIIIMTNFTAPNNVSQEDIEQIINGFKEDNFQVDIIGPDIYIEKNDKDWELARHFMDATNGETATFEYVKEYLLFHKKRAINAVPYNVDLNIGPNIKIPVSSFIRTRDEPAVKQWKKAVKDPVTSTASSTEGIVKQKQHINMENQTPVSEDKTIKGYHYGQQIIPFPDTNNSLTYDSGEKCLSLYGFTDSTNLKWQNLNGNGISYVYGRKGDKKAQHALRCLVECMYEMNLVGIARGVYRKGTLPKMYALMPVIDGNWSEGYFQLDSQNGLLMDTDNYIGLSMTSICYKDDIKYMAFPPVGLKKYEHSTEQVQAFKDLIQAMDLTNAYDITYDDKEAFPIGQTVSPSIQYILDSIAYRAMNPGKPLPPPRDDIMVLFKVPPLIEKWSNEPLEKLKKIFTLKNVEHKTKEKQKPPVGISVEIITDKKEINTDTTTSEMPKVQLPPSKTSDVDRIGTINPIKDFEILYSRNIISLAELNLQMTKAIECLFQTNFDGTFAKALETLKYFREHCVAIDPSHYNDWFSEYQKALINRGKEAIVKLINEKKMNFIVKDENPLSTYENVHSHDESQLYENETVPEETELSLDSEDDL